MLIAVLSVKGSPGVTTFSVALAARWPTTTRTLLVEADPSGGDVGTRFSLQSTPGLVSLAAAARQRTDPALAWQHAQTLPGGLPVVIAPPDADRAHAALSTLAPNPSSGTHLLRGAAGMPNTTVIVDCGRIDPGSAAIPIVRVADVLVLLSRAGADDLAHLALRLPTLGHWAPRPVLLLVGDGYSVTDVARELGVAALGRIPDDPGGAAVLSGRRARVRWDRRGPSRSALGRVAHKVATVLAAQATAPIAPVVPVGPEKQTMPARAVPHALDRSLPTTRPTTGGRSVERVPTHTYQWPVDSHRPQGDTAS